jgi:xylulokinase
MAETGLLLDRRDGTPRTQFLPWFDTAAERYAGLVARQAPELERFGRFGIYPSFKCSLAKILWAHDRMPSVVDDAVWLSVADYIAYRLTGVQATDYSLAGRTYAFGLRDRAWEAAWLRQLGLPAELFPPARPSGTPLGAVAGHAWEPIGLAPGTPVAIAGHDHVCAAFGAGAVAPGRALDSMGTAEALIGAADRMPLDEAGLRSGLTFGILPAVDRWYWLGGLSASGRSLDWLRGILGEPALSYAELQELQERMDARPGAILFLPYLAGSGAPHPDPAARAAFIGLSADHTRADLLKAVLEGAAFQMESIRRAAERVIGRPIDSIVAAGGGTRNPRWLQIKADIYGARIDVLEDAEATLFGAALVAGVGCGLYRDADEALAVAARRQALRVEPDAERRRIYAGLFEREFQSWQQRLVATKRDRDGEL